MMMTRLVIILVFSTMIISCSNSLSKKEIEDSIVLGKEIAQATQKTLETNLTQQMKEGGVKAAVPFCNTMAISLTEKMSKEYGVEIKRTSSKVRNELNLPTEEESDIINHYQRSILNYNELEPIVEEEKSGKLQFYAPIILQKKCLNCHGSVGKEITKQTDSLIKSFYPNDLATGFKEGDLRGIWSITLKN